MPDPQIIISEARKRQILKLATWRGLVIPQHVRDCLGLDSHNARVKRQRKIAKAMGGGK